jgi:uncharacterized membrane protein YjfL (UPF0719 family)
VELLTSNLKYLVLGLPFFVLLVLTLLLGKLFYAWTSSYKFDEELTERDNGAFGVHLALFLLGLMIAAGGTLYHQQATDAVSISITAGFCVLCVLLVRLSVWINDRFLLHEFSVVKELVQDRNAGTGFVVGGGCVATGLIINGALSVQTTGEGLATLVGRALLATLVFFVLGQGLLLAGAWVFRRIAGFDVHRTIEDDDNMAAGIAYGGFLVALGIIVRSSLVNASPELLIEIVTSVVYAVLGLLLLLATRVLVDKVLLPASPLSKEVAVDKNPAAGVLAAASFICVALAFGWVITSRAPEQTGEQTDAAHNEQKDPLDRHGPARSGIAVAGRGPGPRSRGLIRQSLQQ